MKNLLAGIALLVGIGIGYWYGKKDSESANFTEKALKTAFKIDFNPESLKTKPRSTDTISLVKAEKLVQNFKAKLHGSEGIGGAKLLAWPDTLYGWVVDAKKIRDVLIKQQDGGKKDICDNIFIELGYDYTDSSTTLVFTGLNNSTVGGVKKDKRIYLKKDAQLWKVDATKSINGILEYVDPCNPRCPE